MYCVFLGRALQTVNPPNASVGSDQTAPTIITGQTAEATIATDDTILIHDTSASALRKMTRANFVSGIGGTNTPNFKVNQSSGQSISNATFTKLAWGTEQWDSDSAFASDKFTVPSGQGGKYWFQATTEIPNIDSGEFVNITFYKNGSGQDGTTARWYSATSNGGVRSRVQVVLNLSASDYIEVYVYHNEGGSQSTNNAESTFSGYKLIE
jgi:hypothetical protein